MNHEQVDSQVARRSALIYVPLSLGSALLFWLLATLLGSFPTVAQFGGAVWVGLLVLIITMPVVTSRVKKMAR